MKSFLVALSDQDMTTIRENSYDAEQDPSISDADLIKAHLSLIYVLDGRLAETIELNSIEVQE